ncbi:hypothetical protein [Methylobacterium hispanicum]|uniref:hypothetical protein n=1 Tax=Methylobacterium hispanicum TaxID=270350 RepID=UPI001EE0542C|nr:hypothetical protein [Methylobacterium hispanicum]
MADRAPLRLAYSGDPASDVQDAGGIPAVELSPGADVFRGSGRPSDRTARSRAEAEIRHARVAGTQLSEGWDRRAR